MPRGWIRGYAGGFWRIIKDKIARMEHVEYNIIIGWNITNEDDIEDF